MSTTLNLAPRATPKQIPGCILWLDGADPAGTGVVPASGTLTTWVDKSGANNNATGGTSPTYSSTTKAVVFSTASSSYLQTSITAIPSSETIFCVFRPTNANLNANNDIFASSTSYGLGFQILGNGTNFSLKYDIWAVAGYAYTSYTIAPGQLVLGSGTFSNQAGTTYLNGGVSVGGPTSTAPYPSGSGTRRVGSGAGGDFFNGSIYELVYYNTVLSQAQRQKIEGYLAQKWGLLSSLPSSHSVNKSTSITLMPKSTFFNPTTMGNCALWLDASDASTTLASGSPATSGQVITTWTDKSGNGQTATSTGSPLLSLTGINGRRTVTLDGNSAFSGSISNGTANFTAFAVLTNGITSPGWQRFLAFANGTNPDYGSTGNLVALDSQNGVGAFTYERNGNVPSSTLIPFGIPFIYAIVITGSAVQLFYNGTSFYTGTTANANFTYTNYYVSRYSAGGYSWIGSASEILVYNSSLLSTSQFQTVYNYLSQKWNIGTISLGKAMTLTPKNNYISLGLRYRFDATVNVPTTTWTDANGYGNITLYNTPTVVAGAVNYVRFNGTSQYGASVDMTNLTAFTITMWIRTSSTANNGTFYLKPHLIGEGSGGNASKDFGLTIGGGYAGIWSGIGSTDTQNQSETNTSAANYIANGAWHELTVTSTYSTGTLLYVDGTQFGSALSVSQATESGQNWYIAATNYLAGGPNCWAAVDLSVILLYTRGLSSVEVTTNYNSYRSRFGR